MPFSDMVTLEYRQPEAILPPSDCEPSGNRGGQASGSGENHGSEGDKIPEEKDSDEESSSESSRPSKKRNLDHMMEVDSYPIDYLNCATTYTDLLKLRSLYNIPEDVILTIPEKGDVPSRLPKGYVTLHMESFKLGVRLPLSALLCQDIRWHAFGSWSATPKRVEGTLDLFCIMGRCQLGEPSLVEIKNL